MNNITAQNKRHALLLPSNLNQRHKAAYVTGWHQESVDASSLDDGGHLGSLSRNQAGNQWFPLQCTGTYAVHLIDF